MTRGMMVLGRGRRPGLALVVVVALAAAFAVPPTASAAAEATPPPMADAVTGPYEVGVTTTTLAVAHRERDLPVHVWYPAEAGTGTTAATYDLEVVLPPPLNLPIVFQLPSPTALQGAAIVDGELPVVVFSHGLGGVAFQSPFLVEALASHGYLVVAADHLGHTFSDLLPLAGTIDLDDLDESDLDDLEFEGEPDHDRPADVTALLDALEAGTLVPDVVGDGADLDRVAVAGHSYGGYTSLAVAGGNPAVGYEADPRVDAIVPIAPLATDRVLTDADLAAVTVPALFIGGTEDALTPLGPNVDRAISLLSSSRIHRLDLEDTGHFHFADICAIADAVQAQLGALAPSLLPLIPGYPETCDGSMRDAGEVQDLTSLATVGFLLDTIGGPLGTDPDPGLPAAPRPALADAYGAHPIGVTSTTVQLPHRDAPQPVEIWYPAEPTSAAAAPPATHQLPLGLDEMIRSVPIEMVVQLLELAGVSELVDLLDLLALLEGMPELGGIDLGGIQDIRALLPLLTLLGITEVGQVLQFLGLDDLGDLLDLLGLGGMVDELALLRIPAQRAVQDPDLADGTHPLVVFSHGLGSIRFQSLSLVESLASHGFVVVSVDHHGTSLGDPVGLDDPIGSFGAIADGLTLRPLDVSRLLDTVEAGTLAPELLAGRVDTTAVGVTGHSFGGYTTLATASGKTMPGRTAPADERVAALAPIAPATRVAFDWLTDAELAAIDQPTLLIAGTRDTLTPIEPNVTRPYRLIAGEPVYRIDIVDADHVVFADAFGDIDLGDLLPMSTPDGWSAPASDHRDLELDFRVGPFATSDEVRTFTQRSVAGFFLEELVGGEDPGGPDPIVFSDIAADHLPHGPAVYALAAEGILLGHDDGTFRPRGEVTRGQLASALARTLELEPGDPAAFTDLARSPHAGNIGALAELGLVQGFADGRFRPGETVSRDQVAAIIARWLALDPVASGPFGDLRASHAGAVNALVAAGVVEGVAADRFAPRDPVRRGQLATLLVRARPLAP